MQGERGHSCHTCLPPARLAVEIAVEMGDAEAPNLRTVEAKRKAKWPPQGQATEQRRGPDRLTERCCTSATQMIEELTNLQARG